MKLHFLLAALLAANSFSASAQQVKEKLNRAPVAVKTSQGILVSWRSLTSDAKNLPMPGKLNTLGLPDDAGAAAGV